MRLIFWGFVAMAAFILLSSSSIVKADQEENSGGTATWPDRFCNHTTHPRFAMRQHLKSLRQALHKKMLLFDLHLAGYVQSTLCFADEQTAESVTRDLYYVLQGLTCLNSTLQNISRVNRRRLNEVIGDVSTLATAAKRSTSLSHLLRPDDCSLWTNYSEYVLLLSYSLVNRTLSLAHDLENLCSHALTHQRNPIE